MHIVIKSINVSLFQLSRQGNSETSYYLQSTGCYTISPALSTNEMHEKNKVICIEVNTADTKAKQIFLLACWTEDHDQTYMLA